MSQHAPTGLRNADRLIDYATSRGLTVEVKITDYPAEEVLSGYRSVVVTIATPCPERFKGTLLYSGAEFETLTAFFHKWDDKGARARWSSAYRHRMYPGRTKRIKTLRRVHSEVRWMGEDAARWQRLADKEAAADS
jgi:hypothetical protein